MGRTKKLEGIQTRVGSDGLTRYRAAAYVKGKRRWSPWTLDVEKARTWRAETLLGVSAGASSARRLALGRASEVWIEGLEDGSILNRSGHVYKPSTVRGYKRDIAICVRLLGERSYLDDIRLANTTKVVWLLLKEGQSGSRVKHTMISLRALYCWAIPAGYAAVNPCVGLRLPAREERRRERVASPSEVRRLAAALSISDRAAFGLAAYAGLRAGELLALRWADIDLDLRTIRIDRALDTGIGVVVDPKTYAGHRNVPIQDALLEILRDYAMEGGVQGALFPAQRPRRGPGDGEDHFWSLSALRRRMLASWQAAGMFPLGMHEARHTFASTLIAAGVNAKAVQQYMGHSSITITFNRYGHLFPGHEAEVLARLGDFQEGS